MQKQKQVKMSEHMQFMTSDNSQVRCWNLLSRLNCTGGVTDGLMSLHKIVFS